MGRLPIEPATFSIVRFVETAGRLHRVVYGAPSPGYRLLQPTGDAYDAVAAVAVASALQPALNPALAPRYGAVGAAMPQVAAFSACNGLIVLHVREVFRQGVAHGA